MHQNQVLEQENQKTRYQNWAESSFLHQDVVIHSMLYIEIPPSFGGA